MIYDKLPINRNYSLDKKTINRRVGHPDQKQTGNADGNAKLDSPIASEYRDGDENRPDVVNIVGIARNRVRATLGFVLVV